MAHILGVSAFFHDSAAVLLAHGSIVAAVQEERFSRRKNDARFPHQSIHFCLNQFNLTADQLDAVVFYEKPILKFSRTLETFLALAPRGLKAFTRTLPSWLDEKLDIRKAFRRSLPELHPDCPILFSTHHEAHAASAFFPSPFEEAAILTVDGVGEWATTTIGRGIGSQIEFLEELTFPHSLGLLYSAFTAYCGFRVNSGEYKLMGLAPYGELSYLDQIRNSVVDIRPDGSFRLNLDFFDLLAHDYLTNARFHSLFGGPPRSATSPIEQRHRNVARSIQAVTEEILLGLVRRAHDQTGLTNLCLAGGVALNCVANGRTLREGPFKNLWIQPSAGDAGGALGAALAAWHAPADRGGFASPRKPSYPDAMKGALLGPDFSEAECLAILQTHQAHYERLEPEEQLNRTVEALANGKVVGWVQGRMEFGPRALGNRSILGDPRSPQMQSLMNLKVKFRESFRPFAPVVTEDRANEFFDLPIPSPYMLLVAPINLDHRLPIDPEITGFDRLKQVRSTLPAITHVDNSARIQTVTPTSNPLLHALLERFAKKTGYPVLINTSFNVRGEPIICSPDDAYRCFINSEIDILVIGNVWLDRTLQPHSRLPSTFDALHD